jgi:hypothetical protein
VIQKNSVPFAGIFGDERYRAFWPFATNQNRRAARAR